MRSQTSNTQSQAQGGGGDATVSHYPRLFRVTGGATLVHIEKRGPAFDGLLPLPVAEQLGASLVAQDAKAIGHVLNAIDRRCLLDLMPAWSRLLRIHELQVPLARTYTRPNWEWQEMRDAVVMALCHCEESHALMRWIAADALMRGYAMTAAMATESQVETAGDDAERLARNAAAYRTFAEGRA